MQTLTPERILRVGLGFWASKTLLSAVELGLFTELGKGPRSGKQLRRALALNGRAVPDLPDALVALGFLEREGDDADAVYVNTRESGYFLDRNSPAYIGGLLEMANARLYDAWDGLTGALRSGSPAPDSHPDGGAAARAQLIEGMRGARALYGQALGERLDLSAHRRLVDIGGGSGEFALALATLHPHLQCTSCDATDATVLARQRIAAAGLAERVQAQALDIVRDPWPGADVVTMALVLHGCSREHKFELLRKAHAALSHHGCLVVVDTLIDDPRRRHAGGLLMSLNLLVEGSDGFAFSGADFHDWCRDAGFQRTELVPLAGPISAAVAHK